MAVASASPSESALALVDNIAELGNGLKNGRQGAREALLGACTKLVTELSHPSENLMHWFWTETSHHSIIRIAVDIKLFEALATVSESGGNVEAIAAKCDKKPDAGMVGRMLRHLAAMGTVREVASNTFAPTPTSTAFARPAYQDSILYLVDNYQPVHQALPAYFAKRGFTSPDGGVDLPFQEAYHCEGSHYFEYFQKFNPEMGRRFASMMHVWSEGRPRWFSEGYYPVRGRLINGAEADGPFLVDVGGGSGHDIEGFRMALSDQLPGKLVLQDRPEIIQIAKVGPGAEGMAHDFLTEQPVKGARAYYLHSIIQDWNDCVNTQILKSIVPAMRRGYSKVLINDYVLPNQGAHSAQTALDWELMTCLGSRHRMEEEHRKLYEGAGLKITGIWQHPQSLDSLIELELA